MKIYFCGSIRGGRQDATLYEKIIHKLQEYGEVLTEHVGDSKLTSAGGDGGSQYIWNRDMDWLMSADLVIAECSTPSLGVGYELANAEYRGVPTHVFFNATRGNLSAMIEGSPAFCIHYYSNEKQIMDSIVEIMENAENP